MMIDPFIPVDSSDFNLDEELEEIYKIPDMKSKTYLSLVKKGVKFPPIVIDKNNKLIDGTHRLAIHRKLKKKIWALKMTGKGSGKVFGKWTGKSLYPFSNAFKSERCFNCDELLLNQEEGNHLGSIGVIPNGLPSGELWACPKCGLYFTRKSPVWSK